MSRAPSARTSWRARLWTERRGIDAVVPTPFVVWSLAATRLLTQARTRGELAADVKPSTAAVTLMCAFFGFSTLTDDLPGGRDWGEQFDQWWLLTLKSLQAEPNPGALLARERAWTPARAIRVSGAMWQTCLSARTTARKACSGMAGGTRACHLLSAVGPALRLRGRRLRARRPQHPRPGDHREGDPRRRRHRRSRHPGPCRQREHPRRRRPGRTAARHLPLFSGVAAVAAPVCGRPSALRRTASDAAR